MDTQVMSGGWLAHCKARAQKESSGAFAAKDAVRVPVLFEWILTDIQAPDCAAIKKQVADLGCQSVVPVELTFLKARPDAVLNDHFLKACAPFFLKGLAEVDWEGVKNKIDEVLRQIYTVDIAQFGPEIIKKIAQDLFLFITVKDVQTDDLLGFISCGITPASADGDVKIITCAVPKKHAHRELEKMLFGAVLKIIPDAQRLFIGTRPTNTQAIDLYQSLGFAQDQAFKQDPNHQIALKNFVILECNVDQSHKLREAV